MKKTRLALTAAIILAGCASAPSSRDDDQRALQMIKTSFHAKGIATLDRLDQDAVQRACSSATPLPAAVASQLEASQLATIEWPSDGVYLGNWKAGEKLAQNGRGQTWTDEAGKPGGGNCYNCHQMSKAEISFGTIGPSLYHYGRLRGVNDPASPASAAMVKYTWAKLWNAKAYRACSAMPRFGHEGLLNQDQLRDLMALLLDPKSPVNAQ